MAPVKTFGSFWYLIAFVYYELSNLVGFQLPFISSLL